MYEVLSQLCSLKPMLKFSVLIFYQPLFSIFPLTILFTSGVFPFNNSFPFQKLPTKKAKQKVQKPKVKPQKAKAQKSPLPPSGVFYSGKQGGAIGRSITLPQEKTVPASLNTAQLFCLSLFCSRGLWLSLPQVKAINCILPCWYPVLIGFNLLHKNLC
jgi:hypothetical protein